jgi:hypothetical protein
LQAGIRRFTVRQAGKPGGLGQNRHQLATMVRWVPCAWLPDLIPMWF